MGIFKLHTWVRNNGLGSLALAGAYFVVGWMGTQLALPPGYAMAIFPASGIALAALLLHRVEIWPGIALGSFSLNFWISFHQLPDFSALNFLPVGLGIGFGATLEALIALWFLRHWIDSENPFNRIKDVFLFMCCVGALSSSMSATVGVTALCLDGIADWSNYGANWLTWWLGDTMGILVMVPLILSLVRPLDFKIRPALVGEALLLLGLIVGVTGFIFWTPLKPIFYSLVFLTLPPIVWSAFRFGKEGAIFSILVVYGITISATIQNQGPFVGENIYQSLLLLQTYIAITWMMAHMVAAAIQERKQSEALFQTSEKRLKDIINNTTAVIYIKDIRHRYLLINRQFETLFNVKNDEMAGKTDYDIFSRELADAFVENDNKVLAMKSPVEFEEVAPHEDGLHTYISIKFPLCDSSGNPYAICGISTDINERKRIETILTIQNNVLEKLALGRPLQEILDILCLGLESYLLKSKCSILLFDQDEDCLRHGSAPNLPKEYNAKVDGIKIGPKAGSCGTAAFRKELVVVENIASDPLWEGARGFAKKFGLEACWSIPILDADMEILGTFAVYYPFPNKPKEYELSSIQSLANITGIAIKNKKNAADLNNEIIERKKSEERFDMAVKGSTDGLWDWTDMERGDVWWSPRFYELLEYENKEFEMSFSKFVSFLHPEDKERVEDAVRLHLKNRVLYDIEYRLRTKSGKYKWFHARGQATWDKNGNPQRMSGSVQDITQRKMTEEELVRYREHLQEMVNEKTHDVIIAKENAEMANKAKSQFLSKMSHELRTPLNSILGFGELLAMNSENNFSSRQKSQLDEILYGGKHLLELINEVLDLSTIESGKTTLALKSIDVKLAIEEALTLLEPLAIRKNIKLINKSSGNKDYFVWADNTRFRQILINLISNAIKYNSTGGAVTINTEKSFSKRIKISVMDTGPGIAKENLSRLFEPFNRMELGSENIEGTGIGLSISKRLAELMGGSIEVESELGKGSCFSVKFPEGEKIYSANIGSPGIREKFDVKKANRTALILYIEDNSSNIVLVKQILEQLFPAKLITAVNGEQGLEMAQKHCPELILLDINLPGMDGIAVFQHLKSNEKTNKIPVVALSADAMQAEKEKALKSGMQGYLTKPLNISEFVKTVEKLLTQS